MSSGRIIASSEDAMALRLRYRARTSDRASPRLSRRRPFLLPRVAAPLLLALFLGCLLAPAASAQDLDDNEMLVCTDDIRECPEGSVLSRDPDNNCDFPPCKCSDACPAEVQDCGDDTWVNPDPCDDCNFPPCPTNGTTTKEEEVEDLGDDEIMCTDDMFECPDGSLLSRDPDNNCEFRPCEDNCDLVCSQEVQECADGSSVAGDPCDDCNFRPCPDDVDVAAESSVCGQPGDSCVNEDNWQECTQLENTGCKSIAVMESCPYQYGCTDDDYDPATTITTTTASTAAANVTTSAAAGSSVCGEKPSQCIPEEIWQVCKDLEEVGCESIRATKSCPAQYSCGDAIDVEETSVCGKPGDSCVNERNWQECTQLENTGCKSIAVMESCPYQYGCTDDDYDPATTTTTTSTAATMTTTTTTVVQGCTEEAKECPDGSVVGRDPENNCEFSACEEDDGVGTLSASATVDSGLPLLRVVGLTAMAMVLGVA